MQAEFDLESLYKSLIRHVQRTIQEVAARNISTGLEYYSWDSRGEAELGQNDVLGLAGWSSKENGGLWEVRSGLTLSTYNDENLFREIAILNVIHDLWGEGNTVPMINRDTGLEFTQMVISDFDMMPAGSSELRNYRPIGVELLKTSS